MNEKEISEAIDAIFNSEWMKEEQRVTLPKRKKADLKEQGFTERLMDYKLRLLEEFFAENSNLEDLFKVEQLWKWLSSELKMDLNGLWEDKKAVIEASECKEDYLHGERTTTEIVGDMCKETGAFYRKSAEALWQKQMPHDSMTKIRLKEGITYIAIVNKDGFLTTEPIPVSANPKTQIHFEVRKLPPRGMIDENRHEIHVEFLPPERRLDYEGKEYLKSTQTIPLRFNDAGVEVITVK